jgi:hypothetical protein
MGTKPVKLVPSYKNAIWIQHETGLELLLRFDFFEGLNNSLCDAGETIAEISRNPLLLSEPLSEIIGLNCGTHRAYRDNKERRVGEDNDRYKGHRDVESLKIERRFFRRDGSLSESVIASVPVGERLGASESLLRKLLEDDTQAEPIVQNPSAQAAAEAAQQDWAAQKGALQQQQQQQGVPEELPRHFPGWDLIAGTRGDPVSAPDTEDVQVVEPIPPEPRPRYLHGRTPDHVKLADAVPLQVSVALQPGNGHSVTLRDFQVPSEGATVRLVLFCPGFEVLGKSMQEVKVPADADSDWVLFELRAVREGINDIGVSAYHDAAYLGTLRIEIEVNAAIATGPMVEHSDTMTMRSPENGEVTLTIRYDASSKVYRYSLRGGSLGETDEILLSLIDPPQQQVEKLVTQLNAQARNLTNYTDKNARRWLRGLGENMWEELIPAELKTHFWEIEGKVNRLNILSSGDPIPWEMLYPFKTNGGGSRSDSGFMSERFVVTRWIFGPPPAERIRLFEPYFVVPANAPGTAHAELMALRQRLNGGQTVADLTQLLNLIEQGQFGLLHFASHNVHTDFITASYVPIGDEHFEVTFLRPSFRNLYRERAPLVFMNACRSGGLALNYTHLTGWACRFVQAGVGAFVGSLWEVRDTSARTFAESFYGALLDKKSIGVAMKEGRRAVEQSENADPTWLAYALYGNPGAVAINSKP